MNAYLLARDLGFSGFAGLAKLYKGTPYNQRDYEWLVANWPNIGGSKNSEWGGASRGAWLNEPWVKDGSVFSPEAWEYTRNIFPQIKVAANFTDVNFWDGNWADVPYAARPVPEITPNPDKGPIVDQETPIKIAAPIPPRENVTQVTDTEENLNYPVSTGIDWSFLFGGADKAAPPVQNIYYSGGDGAGNFGPTTDPVVKAASTVMSPQTIATYAAIGVGILYMLKDMGKATRRGRSRRR